MNALDAISPALIRTQQMLFQPFRWGRSWKLSVTAYLARAGTMFLPFPLIYLAFLPGARRGAGVGAAALLAAGVLLLTGLTLLLFALCSRMQYVLFDLVLHRGWSIAPLWKRYGQASWPWTLAKIVTGTALTALIAGPTVGYFGRMFQLLRTVTPGQPPPPELIASLFAGYGLLLGVFGLFFAASSLLTIAMLPSLTLEGRSLRESFRRAMAMMGQEPGAFAGFALLQIALAIVGYMLAVIAFEVVLLLTLAILGAVVVGAGFLLHLLGVPTALLIALGILVGLVVYVGALVYPLMLAIGPVLLFLEAHAIYFLAGRAPLVAERLRLSEMPAAASLPVTLHPVPPPPTPGL